MQEQDPITKAVIILVAIMVIITMLLTIWVMSLINN